MEEHADSFDIYTDVSWHTACILSLQQHPCGHPCGHLYDVFPHCCVRCCQVPGMSPEDISIEFNDTSQVRHAPACCLIRFTQQA